MRDSRNKKTEYLLSEIGEIDDKFLLEAENYRPQRRLLRYRPIIAAACVCCFVVIVLSAVLRSGIIGKSVNGEAVDPSVTAGKNTTAAIFPSKSDNDLYTDEVEDLAPIQKGSGFDLLLASQSGKDHAGYDSFAQIKRESGKTYILWQSVDGGKIFMSRAFSEDEAEYIAENVGIGYGVGDSSPTLEFYVWILRGDGSIISPYLKGSEGNIGNALFEYEAEIMPQEELIGLIADILADK